MQKKLGDFQLQEITQEESENAAISVAEAALRQAHKRGWTDKFRDKQLVTVLDSLGLREDLLHPKEAAS